MAFYSIYEKPGLPLEQTVESAVIIKEGFSFLAFLIPILWIVVKRLWWLLPFYCLLLFVSNMMDPYLSGISASTITVLIALLIGLEAGDMESWFTERKGYLYRASLYARNKADCEERYIHIRTKSWNETELTRKPSDQGAEPKSRKMDQAAQADDGHSILGLFPSAEKQP